MREALAFAHARHAGSGHEHHPTKTFGSFYAWLVVKEGIGAGRIIDDTRDYIFDEMAIYPRKTVLKKTIQTRVRHSIATLADTAKAEPSEVAAALMEAGMLQVGASPSAESDMITFDARASERVILASRGAMFLEDAAFALNATAAMIELLAKTRHLQIVADDHGMKAWTGKAVRREDVETIAARLADVPVADRVPERFVNLDEVIEITGRKMAEVLPMVVSGQIRRTVRIPGSWGFEGLQFDPKELAWIIDPSPEAMTLTEAYRRLAIPPQIGARLTSGKSGAPLLVTTNLARKPWMKSRVRVMRNDFEHFAETYATLHHLAQETGLRQKQIKDLLDARGVPIAVAPTELGIELYRRDDIPEGWAA